MDKIENAAKAAYQFDAVCSARVPWVNLSAHWQEYWRNIAKAVLAA